MPNIILPLLVQQQIIACANARQLSQHTERCGESEKRQWVGKVRGSNNIGWKQCIVVEVILQVDRPYIEELFRSRLYIPT